jgi:hypothetical protein
MNGRWLMMFGLGVAMIFSFTASAIAQDQQQGMPKMGQGSGMSGCPMMGGDMKMDPQKMAARLEGRIASLKKAIGIKEDQMDAWNKYVEALKSRQTSMQGKGMMGAMQKGTAVERMDAHIKHMEAMVQGMKAVKPATEALYQVLSNEQKKTADAQLGMGCRMM